MSRPCVSDRCHLNKRTTCPTYTHTQTQTHTQTHSLSLSLSLSLTHTHTHTHTHIAHAQPLSTVGSRHNSRVASHHKRVFMNHHNESRPRKKKADQNSTHIPKPHRPSFLLANKAPPPPPTPPLLLLLRILPPRTHTSSASQPECATMAADVACYDTNSSHFQYVIFRG